MLSVWGTQKPLREGVELAETVKVALSWALCSALFWGPGL